jgi:plasmid stabilization system protein ParE
VLAFLWTATEWTAWRLAFQSVIEFGVRAAERAIDSIQEAIHVLAPAPGAVPKAPET